MINSIGGFFHIFFAVMAILLSVFYKWIRTYFVFYIEVEMLSWLIFNNECLFSYLHKKEKNPKYKLGESSELTDIDLPFWLHLLGNVFRTYFYYTFSSEFYTMLYFPLYILLNNGLRNKLKLSIPLLYTRWRYLLIPFVLFLFHGPNTPFDFSSKTKHVNVIIPSLLLVSIFLLYIITKYHTSKDLYEPILLSYIIVLFIGIGTKFF